MSEWTLRVCSYTGTVEGEIRNASDRSFSFALNRMTTGSFKIPLNHPRAATLLQGDCLVQLFQDKTLRVNMEVVSVEEVADDTSAGSLVVTVADAAYWRLTHRLVGTSGPGEVIGTAGSPVAKHTIVMSILLSLNSDGDTGVRQGSGVSVGSTYVAWRFKPFTECLLELSRTLSGYDFKFDHYHPFGDMGGGVVPVASTAIADLETASALGTTRPNTIFEYGTGRRNIKAYKRQVSREGLMTRGWSLPPGFPETTEAVISAESLSAVTARGIHEAVLSSEISGVAARAELLREHLAVRKQPRQLITFTPAENGQYKFNTDYEIGDIVTGRAKTRNGIRFNALFRVYGVDVKLSAEGMASYDLTLVPED